MQRGCQVKGRGGRGVGEESEMIESLMKGALQRSRLCVKSKH